jgi:putative hydrolase of the HAD superfamily
VIWDLGGVLVRSFDRSARASWEARLGIGEYDLERAIFAGEIGRKAALGQATAQDVWNSVWKQLGLDREQGQALQRDFWRGDGLDDELIGFIRGLKPDYRIGMITNAWPEVRGQIEQHWQISDVFHEMVISAEVGLVKPDRRIYQLMLKKLAVRAESSIFVDDFEENIAAATALGMHGVRFEGRGQAIEAINRLLVPAQA